MGVSGLRWGNVSLVLIGATQNSDLGLEASELLGGVH